MLAMVTSWFTPTFLFLMINIMVATIVITSRFSHQKTSENQQLGDQLVRAPSLLYRVRSINFSFHSFDSHANSVVLDSDRSTQLVRTPSILNRLMSGNISTLYRSERTTHSETLTIHPNPEEKTTNEVKRSNSDSGGEILTTAPEKMTKFESKKLGKKQVEERDEIERRRPSAVRVDKRESIGEVEEGIDAKADDFIIRFKQQLKLQRLESLLRYRDLLKGK